VKGISIGLADGKKTKSNFPSLVYDTVSGWRIYRIPKTKSLSLFLTLLFYFCWHFDKKIPSAMSFGSLECSLLSLCTGDGAIYVELINFSN
jgi:hypothetical protein